MKKTKRLWLAAALTFVIKDADAGFKVFQESRKNNDCTPAFNKNSELEVRPLRASLDKNCQRFNPQTSFSCF